MNQKYIAEVQKTYNKNYQIDEYRGVILDENNHIIQRCPNIHQEINIAMADAKELLNQIISNPTIQRTQWNTPRFQIWQNNSFITNGLKILGIIMFPFLLLMIIFTNILNLNENIGIIAFSISIILCPLSFFYVLRRNYQMINYGTYIYDDGLYIVIMPNDNHKVPTILMSNRVGFIPRIGFSAIGTACAIEGLRKNDKYIENINGIRDIMKLSDKPIIWKFNYIESVKKINNNKYEIIANYTDYKSDKTKQIKYKLKNQFNNFNELVNTMNSMSENKSIK